MNTANLLNAYVWLVDTINAAGHITLDEINRRWAQSALNETHESRIPRRTFLQWRNAAEELFHISIECDKSTNTYYIAHALDQNITATQQWLLNAFSVSNVLNHCEDIRDQILLEDIPSDARYLTTLLDAMRAKRKVACTYQRFDATEPHDMELSPYCVKVFKQRWYVAGRSSDHPHEVRVYSLDRMQGMHLLDSTYTIPAKFNAKKFFYNSYGVFAETGSKPKEIRVRVTNKAACYLRSLPLHHSQREIESTDTHSVFSFVLHPTIDFVQELRTHGAELEVLCPESLRENFRQLGKKYDEIYGI